MWNFKTNRLQRQTLYAALILAILSVILVVALRHAEAKRPDVVLYSSEFQMPVNRGALIDRIIPRNWAWAWKLRDKIRGKVKLVVIFGRCFEIRSTVEAAVGALELNSPTLERDNTRIWLISGTEGDRLRNKLSQIPNTAQLGRASTSTAENSGATLRSGPRAIEDFGFRLETFPRIHEDKIDLTSVFSYTEPVTADQSPSFIRTNAFVATRIQFPTNSSVLILTPDKSGATNRSIALILTAKRK